MNLSITAPPSLTGNTQKDTVQLNYWCRNFYTQLKRILYCLDTGNIVELDASRINGTLPIDNVNLSGVNVKITGDTINIATPDGSQYLRLSGGSLSFCGNIINPTEESQVYADENKNNMEAAT